MKPIKYLILFSILFCHLLNCNGQSETFDLFMRNFKQLEFPFIVDDNEPINNKAVFSQGFKRSDFLKYLNEIKEYTTNDSYFYYGGRAKYHEFDILIYRIIDFGDAIALDTVRIELVVFNPEGKMLSKMVIAGQVTEDYIIDCKLNADMKFTISKLDGDLRVLKRQKYFIDFDGLIKESAN